MLRSKVCTLMEASAKQTTTGFTSQSWLSLRFFGHHEQNQSISHSLGMCVCHGELDHSR